MSLRLTGFYELEAERQQERWQRERFFTTYLLNVHIDQKHRLEPKDLIELPGEKEPKPEVKILSKQERFEKFARMDRAMKQKYG